MELTKKYLINGPNNVFRLTNDDKIIYLFGDLHKDINDQYECSIDKTYDSINFDQFLVKFMNNNKNDTYDLFIEQSFDELKNDNHDYNSIYIHNIRKIFSKNMQFDKNNKIIKSPKYPNFRFHYFDFRDEFPSFLKISNLRISKKFLF